MLTPGRVTRMRAIPLDEHGQPREGAEWVDCDVSGDLPISSADYRYAAEMPEQVIRVIRAMNTMSWSCKLTVDQLRGLMDVLGIRPVRTPLERHLLARMSRVRRARQRR